MGIEIPFPRRGLYVPQQQAPRLGGTPRRPEEPASDPAVAGLHFLLDKGPLALYSTSPNTIEATRPARLGTGREGDFGRVKTIVYAFLRNEAKLQNV